MEFWNFQEILEVQVCWDEERHTFLVVFMDSLETPPGICGSRAAQWWYAPVARLKSGYVSYGIHPRNLTFSPLKIGLLPKGNSSSNHHFSWGELLNFGGVSIWMLKFIVLLFSFQVICCHMMMLMMDDGWWMMDDGWQGGHDFSAMRMTGASSIRSYDQTVVPLNRVVSQLQRFPWSPPSSQASCFSHWKIVEEGNNKKPEGTCHRQLGVWKPQKNRDKQLFHNLEKTTNASFFQLREILSFFGRLWGCFFFRRFCPIQGGQKED